MAMSIFEFRFLNRVISRACRMLGGPATTCFFLVFLLIASGRAQDALVRLGVEDAAGEPLITAFKIKHHRVAAVGNAFSVFAYAVHPNAICLIFDGTRRKQRFPHIAAAGRPGRRRFSRWR